MQISSGQGIPEVHDQGFDPVLDKEPIKYRPFAAIPQDQALLSASQLAGVEDGIRLTIKVVYQWIAQTQVFEQPRNLIPVLYGYGIGVQGVHSNTSGVNRLG